MRKGLAMRSLAPAREGLGADFKVSQAGDKNDRGGLVRRHFAQLGAEFKPFITGMSASRKMRSN